MRNVLGRRMQMWLALAGCAMILLLFAVLSFSAARTKSATHDEPLHALAGHVYRTTGDCRLDPEDPVLFSLWGSLAHRRHSLKIDYESYFWGEILINSGRNEWPFVWLTLYRTPGNDGDAFVQRTRGMYVLVGAGLGALIAWWSWQLAGAWAALVAAVFYSLDPNMMAHAPLVKNDVMITLVLAALAFSLWRFGRRGTWLSLISILVCCAAAINVKFSGVLAGPITLLALLARALLPQVWVVAGLSLSTRWQRLSVVPIVCFLAALTTYAAIWSFYGFRFLPTPQAQKQFDMQNLLLATKFNRAQTHLGSATQLTRDMVDRYPPGTAAELVMWADRNQFLPQAWLYGFLYTYTQSLIRNSYLLGQTSLTGWWYYFPYAMLFKTPTATLISVPFAIAGWLLLPGRQGQLTGAARSESSQVIAGWMRVDWWTVICLLLPPALYAASAINTVVNLGLRHILPVYPFLFIAIAVGLAGLIRRFIYAGPSLVALLVIGLAAECLPAWPNYIPFFNAPSRSWKDPIDLLGDSNLDWGQDLKLLAAWQQEHSDRPLYLAYFGLADPAAHGVNAIQVPPFAGGSPFASETQMPHGRCYLAISATHLQGMYINAQVASQMYRPLRKRIPTVILGGSIYVYELP